MCDIRDCLRLFSTVFACDYTKETTGRRGEAGDRKRVKLGLNWGQIRVELGWTCRRGEDVVKACRSGQKAEN
jgi:hypothetical protein